MPGDRTNNRKRVIPFRLRRRLPRLVTCSVCLRVREGRAWIEASEVIRRLRTFEQEDVVRLTGALCERCELVLRLRREGGSTELAA